MCISVWIKTGEPSIMTSYITTNGIKHAIGCMHRILEKYSKTEILCNWKCHVPEFNGQFDFWRGKFYQLFSFLWLSVFNCPGFTGKRNYPKMQLDVSDPKIKYTVLLKYFLEMLSVWLIFIINLKTQNQKMFAALTKRA